jgi:hypothetical protein
LTSGKWARKSAYVGEGPTAPAHAVAEFFAVLVANRICARLDTEREAREANPRKSRGNGFMKPWLKHSMRLSTALMLAFSVVNAQAAEEDDESDEEDEDVEEMVVTGSYIRRDNFDLPSPRDIVDAVDLSLSGTSDLGDIVFDQTFQIGVNAQTATTEFHGADDQQFQQGAETWANLRGLGTRATMTMMDGHRVPASVTGIGSSTRRAGSDLNNMYPGIAIGRIETILDGASALYGASAVSGVINLVPRKDFDGLMVNYEYSQPIENGTPAKRMGLLAGAQGDRTSIIFALEIRDQARMKQTDRPDYVISSANWTGQYLHPYQERPWAHPGEYLIPHRGSSGELSPNASVDAIWYRLPDAQRWGWGNTGGWLAERYSPTRSDQSNSIPAAGPAGGVFSPVYDINDPGVVPMHYMGSRKGGRGAWRGPQLSDNMLPYTGYSDPDQSGGIWTASVKTQVAAMHLVGATTTRRSVRRCRRTTRSALRSARAGVASCHIRNWLTTRSLRSAAGTTPSRTLATPTTSCRATT